MSAWRAGILALLPIVACGGENKQRDISDPPSGVVDPGNQRLASASGGDFQPPPDSSAAPGAANDGVVPPLPDVSGLGPGAGAAPPPSPPAGTSGREPTAAAQGQIRMTREHCDTLGRKFADLALRRASGGPANKADADKIKAEADKMGSDFAAKCSRDMVGTTIPKSEYDCMIRVQSESQLLSCK